MLACIVDIKFDDDKWDAQWDQLDNIRYFFKQNKIYIKKTLIHPPNGDGAFHVFSKNHFNRT